MNGQSPRSFPLHLRISRPDSTSNLHEALIQDATPFNQPTATHSLSYGYGYTHPSCLPKPHLPFPTVTFSLLRSRTILSRMSHHLQTLLCSSRSRVSLGAPAVPAPSSIRTWLEGNVGMGAPQALDAPSNRMLVGLREGRGMVIWARWDSVRDRVGFKSTLPLFFL